LEDPKISRQVATVSKPTSARFRILSLALLVTLCSNAALADTQVDPKQPVEHWKPSIQLRIRYEFGDQAGREAAHAVTGRARLGLATPEWSGFQGFAEGEHTEALDRTTYQAASVDGLGRNLTVIADPESTELNQLWLQWRQFPIARAVVGRQRWILPGARFVGDVDWRQNQQTYDAATLALQPLANLNIDAGHIWRVNRIFGSQHATNRAEGDFDSRSYLARVEYDRFLGARFEAYGYFLDLKNGAGANASNRTLGGSISGSTPVRTGQVGYHVEYALQRDAATSRLDYRAHYFGGQVWGRRKSLGLGIGCEILGGDHGVGFQTPLATLHKWNGWADVFLNTPASGLVDRYAYIELPLPVGFTATLAHHDFSAQDSHRDYGHETDLIISRDLPLGVKGAIKYAAFRSENPAFSNLRRLMIQLDYQH